MFKTGDKGQTIAGAPYEVLAVVEDHHLSSRKTVLASVDGTLAAYHADGRSSAGHNNPGDLILERESVVRHAVLFRGSNGMEIGTLAKTAEQAMRSFDGVPFACVEISAREGDGL